VDINMFKWLLSMFHKLFQEPNKVHFNDEEYWVNIRDYGGTVPNIDVYLYERELRKRTYGGILPEYKYREIYHNISGWNRYKRFKTDYIGLIKDTIIGYESYCSEQKEYEEKLREQARFINNWDGKIS
jgi:hypothetical protein